MADIAPISITLDAFCKEGSETTVDLMSQVIRKIVEVEGPVSYDVVSRRLCDACGIEKITAKVSARVEYFIKRTKVYITDSPWDQKFLYKDSAEVGVISETYRVGGDRTLADVPMEELVACAIHITSVQYGMPEENLAKEVASAFGFKRAAVTSQNYKICAEAVKYALDNKYLVVDGNGRVILVP